MRQFSLFTLFLSFLAFDLPAQGTGAEWSVTATTGTAPSHRRESPGAASTTHMYVFGGRSGGSGGVVQNDLWAFDGTTWTMMTANGAVGSPPARDRAGICWDADRDKLIVFGGDNGSGTPLSDTWEWDPVTNAWTDLMIPAGPPARRWCSIAYDPINMGILLFGGLDANGAHLNDTWVLFSGQTWVQVVTTTTPSTRRQHHLVTRPDFADVILCAGQDASLSAPAKWRTDTFSWNGLDWTLIPTLTTPVAVVANSAVYDSIRQRIVMTGGNGISGGSPTSQTSEFDVLANDWIIRGPATFSTPDPVIGRISRYFMAFVPAQGKIYKISGQNPSGTGAGATTTCEYQSSPIASAVTVGLGCSGFAGGVVTMTPDNRPWIGETFSATVTGLAPGSIVFALAGGALTSIPLQTLDPAGVVSCDLLVTPDLVAPIPNLGGSALYPIAVPPLPGLAGFVFHIQVLQVEFAPNVGASSSNALSLTLGLR